MQQLFPITLLPVAITTTNPLPLYTKRQPHHPVMGMQSLPLLKRSPSPWTRIAARTVVKRLIFSPPPTVHPRCHIIIHYNPPPPPYAVEPQLLLRSSTTPTTFPTPHRHENASAKNDVISIFPTDCQCSRIRDPACGPPPTMPMPPARIDIRVWSMCCCGRPRLPGVVGLG